MSKYEKFPAVHDLPPLGSLPGDNECILEIAQVIAKHNKQDRFLIGLAHHHDNLPFGVIPVEYHLDNGWLAIVPTRVSEIPPERLVPTHYKVTGSGTEVTMGYSEAYVHMDDGSHQKTHNINIQGIEAIGYIKSQLAQAA